MIEANIPLAIQVVIDDVGWWCGADGHERGEPYRSGCVRDHVPADYAAIVELGKRLGMRPQAAMIMCEWDRQNILRDVPSATWQGRDWDNSRWVGPWLDEAAHIIREGREHFELTIHGIGHEYWDEQGVASRAEWHDREGKMRRREEVLRHLEYYGRLLDQNGLGPLPESFVPAAFLHRFGAGKDGMGAILAQHGVKYMSTPYGSMFRDRDTEGQWFGVDEGLLTVDRGRDLLSWHVTGGEPQGEITGPICGMHWPNLLHADPEHNGEVVDRWVRLLKPYGSRWDRMLARNAAEGFSQCVYHTLGEVRVEGERVVVDVSAARELGASGVLDSFYVKLKGAGKVEADGFVTAGETEDGAGHRVVRLERG